MQQLFIPDRTTMPPLGEVSKINLTEPDVITFRNGMEAYIIKAGKEEITRIDIVFEAGSAFQNKKLTANSVNSLLKEGTSSKSSSEIAHILDYYGAYLHTQNNKDTASVTLYTLTKHLENLLPLMAEIVTDAIFPENELAIYLDRQKQQFLVNIEKVRYRASLEFNKMVFGENSAYGQVLQQNDFNNITKDDVITFYRQYYNPENAYIIISGNVDDKLISVVGDYLGNIQYKAIIPERKKIVYTTDPVQTEAYFEKNDAMQSAIRIGKQIISKTHPDFPALQMLNTVLGGYFGSRLMTNLREDKGYTYGIGSFIQSYKHATYFSISTEVNANYTNAALNEIFNEIETLKENPIDTEELQLVKNYLFGNFLKSFDGPLALAERYRTVKDSGLDFSFYTKNLETMMNLSPLQLIETANTYFEKESLLFLVVGKKQ